MTDLQELFSRDPLTFTREADEVGQLIAAYREKRGQFILGNKKAGSAKPAKQSTAAKLGLSIKLDLKSALKKSIAKETDDGQGDS